MAKPLLLSGGSGKVLEFVGNATGQTPVWSEGLDEWVLGTPSSSGGGGVTWYLNENTAAGSPTTNLPTGASGALVKNLSATADGTSTTVASTANVPVFPAIPELIAGFVTDAAIPGLTGIPAGLWDFNIWAQADGNTTNQSYLQFKVYKYDGSTAPTLLATSVLVYLYDPADVTQYTASVLIPAGTSLLTTDRIYVEVVGGSTTSNRQITLHFGNGKPSHVHTTIQVPVNLATGVSGTLPVANGGTGVSSLTSNALLVGGSTVGGLSGSVSGQFARWNNTSGAWAATALTGTTNRVTVTSDATSTTLSLPQDIATTSQPTFDQVTTTSRLVTNALRSRTNSSGFSFIQIDPASGATNIVLQPTTTTAPPSTFFAGGSTSSAVTAGGSVYLTGGGGGSGAANGGDAYVRGGGVAGTGLNGRVFIGDTSTRSVEIGAPTTTTTLNGTVSLATALPIASGGTNNASLNVTLGYVYYGDGSKLVGLAPGTSGQFLQTQGAGADPQWAAAGGGGSTPYDISGEFVGTPVASAVIMRFVAVRPFTLSDAVVARFNCTTGPTSTATFTVNVEGVSKGAVAINTSATSGTGTLTSTNVLAGHVITVVATTPANIINVWFTLPGTV